MRIFKSKLQKKLIFSFIIVAISPMIISLLIVTRIVSSQVEEDIERRIHSAFTTVETSIQNIQNKASIVAKLILSQPEFVDSFKNRDYKKIENLIRRVKSEIPIEVILPQEVKAEKFETTIMYIEIHYLKKLLAGVIAPIIDNNGETIGRLIIGDFLDERFDQVVSQTTDVEVRVLTKVSRDSDTADTAPLETLVKDIRVPQRAIQEVFEQGNTYYDNRGTKVKGYPYAALYKPLLSVEGNMLGFIFLGIPKTYAFQTVLKQYLPFLLGIWILVAGALGYFITHGITYPISKFIKGANAIASGDLNQHIKLSSKDEIGNLAAAFNNMAEELKKMQKMQEELRKLDRLSALGQLAAEVAHEVKNPLGIIKNSAQILESNPLNEIRRKETVNFIIEEAERINRVIDNFLQFARPPKMKKEKTNIIDVVDRTVRLISDTLTKNNIEVIKDYTDSIPLIRADPSQLQQLFLNLILNAIEAMPKGGKLKISTQLEREEILIAFSDTGRGVSSKLKKKIFEPFYTTREHGTGLGLAIAQKIVEGYGGRITLESKVGKGATFKILFPIG